MMKSRKNHSQIKSNQSAEESDGKYELGPGYLIWLNEIEYSGNGFERNVPWQQIFFHAKLHEYSDAVAWNVLNSIRQQLQPTGVTTCEAGFAQLMMAIQAQNIFALPSLKLCSPGKNKWKRVRNKESGQVKKHWTELILYQKTKLAILQLLLTSY